MEKLKITPENLYELEKLNKAVPASIQLQCTKASHDNLDQVFLTLQNSGDAIIELECSLLFPSKPFEYNLLDFDFAKYCPYLETLKLGRFHLSESVLNHPKLKLLALDESWLFTSDPCNLGIEKESFLEEIVLNDTNWSNEKRGNVKLVIGSKSHLRRFDYSLDEDYVSNCTDFIEIKDAPFLEEIYGNICINWKMVLCGSLPKLQRIYGSGGQYGQTSFDLSQVNDQSSVYIRKIRDNRK